jgi:L-rhamnose isomerase
VNAGSQVMWGVILCGVGTRNLTATMNDQPIGARNMLRALLMASLEPVEKFRAAENGNDFTTRLALQEEIKSLPFGAV